MEVWLQVMFCTESRDSRGKAQGWGGGECFLPWGDLPLVQLSSPTSAVPLTQNLSGMRAKHLVTKRALLGSLIL